MADLELRITASEAELLDAGEAIEALLDRDGEGDFPPSLMELLLALDDAVTRAVAESHDPAGPPMRRRDVPTNIATERAREYGERPDRRTV